VRTLPLFRDIPPATLTTISAAVNLLMAPLQLVAMPFYAQLAEQWVVPASAHAAMAFAVPGVTDASMHSWGGSEREDAVAGTDWRSWSIVQVLRVVGLAGYVLQKCGAACVAWLATTVLIPPLGFFLAFIIGGSAHIKTKTNTPTRASQRSQMGAMRLLAVIAFPAALAWSPLPSKSPCWCPHASSWATCPSNSAAVAHTTSCLLTRQTFLPTLSRRSAPHHSDPPHSLLSTVPPQRTPLLSTISRHLTLRSPVLHSGMHINVQMKMQMHMQMRKQMYMQQGEMKRVVAATCMQPRRLIHGGLVPMTAAREGGGGGEGQGEGREEC